MIEVSSDDKSMVKLTCPLCVNLISKCVTTLCGHSYCESCLEEYLIFKSHCFICEVEQREGWNLSIRSQPLRSCFAIDTMIAQLLENCTDDALKVQKLVHEERKLTLQSKRLGSEVAIGDQVDIRDKDYVWCKGIIKMIIESAKRAPVLLVHYDDFDDDKDEALHKNSPRLAKAGVYTNRSEIPRYRLKPGRAGD